MSAYGGENSNDSDSAMEEGEIKETETEPVKKGKCENVINKGTTQHKNVMWILIPPVCHLST